MRIQGDLTGVEDGTPVLVTHDARFHCDDALAIGLLRCLPEFTNSVVLRTREAELWAKGTVVVDVGGVYDPSTNRFDHHQRGFNEFYDESWRTVTKMSSAGMVYKHFGRRILLEAFNIPESHVDVVMKNVYEHFIESVDAIDNGVNITPKGVEPLYLVRSDLSSRVARLNENWNEWSGDRVSAADFLKAIKMAMEEFSAHATYCRDVWLPARVIVEQGVNSRMQTHASGRVIEMEIGCPFEEHLASLETDLGLDETNDLLFAIYPNVTDRSSWRVKAIKISMKSFDNRMNILKSLGGLREEQIKELGFEGVSFVHAALFLAGCHTRDACLALVSATLKEGGL